MNPINAKSNRLTLDLREDKYTVQEACALLGLTIKTINALVSSGTLHMELENGEAKILKSSLLTYKEGMQFKDAITGGKMWEMKGDFSTNGLKKMAKRTFQELASNMEELIVNSYDADATNVQVILDIDKNTLSIMDDGNGMNEKTLSSYAIYGESEKSSAYNSPRFNRSPIGEYGMGGKLAISNIAQKCRIVTRKNGLEHAFSMDKTQLDSAKYLSEVKRKVFTRSCDKNAHGTTIFMEDLLYKSIDIDRLVERFSTKMPKSQTFKINFSVIKDGQLKDLEIKEPTFEYEEKFDFEDTLSKVGKVKLQVFFTKEPIPATKQGIWTKINGRIVNEKQEWFGLLNFTSGQRYRWRLYGYGEANGLKDFVTFSKNDFVDSPEYREYYSFVHKSLETVQKTLLKKDETLKKEKERNLIKEVEKEVNDVVMQLNKLELLNASLENGKVKKVFTPKIEDAPAIPYPDVKTFTDGESINKRGKDKQTRRNQSLSPANKVSYSGKNYTINTIDLSEKGDLVSFDKDNHTIEINERHPLYLRASKDGSLHGLVRDVAFTQISNDYSEGEPKMFNTVFNELVKLYVQFSANNKTEFDEA